MSINIIFKGFTQELPAAEAIAVLARVFNGDRAKAEEAFITPNYVLRTIGSKAEIGLILPRLEKLGLLCEVVEQSQAASGAFDDYEVTVRMIACQFCGYEQPTALACRKCGKSFAAVKKINWKPAVNLQAEEDAEPDTGEAYALSVMDRVRDLNVFTARNAMILVSILVMLAGLGFVTLPGFEPELNANRLKHLGVADQCAEAAGARCVDMSADEIQKVVDLHPELKKIIDDAAAKVQPHKNPIAMLIGGILTSDPKEVAKTMTYNPESGENPYAKRLQSLGIDQKEFSEAAAGIKGGEISIEQVQETIDNNPLLKKGVEDAMNEAGSSTGGTETDKAIEEIK